MRASSAIETALGRDGLGTEALGGASERRASEAGCLVTMRVPKSIGMASNTPNSHPTPEGRPGNVGG
ncbi:hypothetical protein FH063_004656 [Azospirillum argentinense]|uniref:Uncharacterized protein n=1 Tax=Azospirillum argentinense TaxID=2970906 RepID=A0A5B0KYN1_9PROT|nr:hypothetical protein FH063_004656 [Azospirillum argentinense]